MSDDSDKIVSQEDEPPRGQFRHGLLFLVFGVAVAVFITIFGWGGVVKGIWLIVFPNTLSKITQIYQKKPFLLRAHSLIILIVGLFLTVKAYFG